MTFILIIRIRSPIKRSISLIFFLTSFLLSCTFGKDTSTTLKETVFWGTNPSSGAQLYVKVIPPDEWNGTSQPTIILVPDGLLDNTLLTINETYVENFTSNGFTVVIFDPDGRGKSEGEEDKNGYIHQDGLAKIILTIADLPDV